VSAPAFTAVIPAYNAEQTLPSAIESVLAQTRQDFELIVVDDGSRDATLARATKFESSHPTIRVISHPRNLGLASARNTGIAYARAPYIAFLDADDLWMPSYLEAMGSVLDADPGAGFAYTDGWALDDASGRVRRATVMARQRPPVPPPKGAQEFLRELVRRNFVLAEATVRKAAIEVVGSFNPALRAVEDYELWLRLLAHGYRAARPAGLHLIRRDRADSMSKDPIVMRQALIETMRILIQDHPAPDDVKALARRRMAQAEREIAVLSGVARKPVAGRLRGVLGRLRRGVLGTRLYYTQPPPDVARALGRRWDG
jgi:glycosyltransferase involved in cell wall biosynthesis